MGSKVDSFLKQLNDHLKKMPEVERNDVIKEIKGHILESIKHGKSESEVLARLEDPKILAKAYLSEHIVQQRPTAKKGLLDKFAFLMSINLLSSIITLLLGIVSFVFGLGAIALLLGVISSASLSGLDYFGILSRSFEYYFELYHLPATSDIPVALLIVVFLGLIPFVCIKLMRRYFDEVTTKYRKFIP